MAYCSYNNHSIYNQGEFNRDYYYDSLNSNYSPYNYPQDPVAISNYNKNSIDSQIFTYDPIIPSSISYSVSSPSDPRYIQYDPTQFTISYSVSSDFNEPEIFEEYDTTPYDGGYNIALTYGNPLPPSDETCYPRSSSAASGVAPVATLPSIGVPAAPTVSPAGKVEAENKAAANDVVKGEEIKPIGSSHENDVVEGEEESGSGSNFGSGYSRRYEVGEMPYGYGLEAMDICEGLFGYWPCVSKCRRRLDDYQYQQAVDCGNCKNPWDGTADYLFGNPNPYVETREVDNYISYGQNFWET